MERAGVTLTSKIKDYFNRELYDVNYMFSMLYYYNKKDNTSYYKFYIFMKCIIILHINNNI